MIKNKAGVWGEIYTARYLRDNKYRIIYSEFRSRFGEIDLIAEKDGVLCFVEVKARNKNTPVRPMEAVDERKQERISLTARSFISYIKYEGETEFDVSEVYLNDDNSLARIDYMKKAF